VKTATPTPRPTPLSLSRPSAPLPKSAVDAMARLERSSIAPAIVRAVTVYETAALRATELAAKAVSDEGPLSDLEADDLAHAEDLMAGHRATLAAAGRLDLVGGA
jgi:hypothetical protein